MVDSPAWSQNLWNREMLCVSGLWRELQAVVQIEMLRPIQTGSEAALAVEQHGYPHLWMELGGRTSHSHKQGDSTPDPEHLHSSHPDTAGAA